MAHTAIIGSGFSSLAAACVLRAGGHRVSVYEKLDKPGGRARTFHQDGFTFDMGPSWYWMPDVFEKYFAQFGKTTQDYYHLTRLDPSYRIYTADEQIDVPASMAELEALFEQRERGAGKRLMSFMNDAGIKYHAGINDLARKPGLSISEFASIKVLKGLVQLQLLSSFRNHVNRHFNDPLLRTLMEFPILFLGATPANTPALYSLMNYADMALGTWYPMGGMGRIVDAFVSLASELGVEFHYNAAIKSISAGPKLRLTTDKEHLESDFLVAGADYHHVDQQLLSTVDRQYTNSYWNCRTMAPSSLIFYVGLNTTVPQLRHHNLFFDADFDAHAADIYEHPNWPKNPLFYVCAPSRTDASVAPAGSENLFILIPTAPGLVNDDEALREQYFRLVFDRIKKHTGRDLSQHVMVKKFYAASNFIADYNAFKGNAYGLANTLKQTALLKPRVRHKRHKNLFFTGQLTAPGPGVPPAIISGEMVANLILQKQ